MNRRGACLRERRVAIEGKIVAERNRKNGVTGKSRGEKRRESDRKANEKIGKDG